jgi:dihydroxyacetone kinase-like protein
MSANMASQLAERSGIKVVKLLTHDDISAGLNTADDDRRGLAGCIPLYKIIGAAAEEGKSIDEIYEIGQRFNNQVATLAVAMRSCTHPQNGATIAELPDGEIEIGMGQHGEGGGGRQQLSSADNVATQMVSLLMRKLQPVKGDKVLLYINGVGATTHMEMSIIFRKAAMVLAEAGIEMVDGKITEFLTVQEQAGFQMILAKLDDDHVELLKNKLSNAPYWVTIGV